MKITIHKEDVEITLELTLKEMLQLMGTEDPKKTVDNYGYYVSQYDGGGIGLNLVDTYNGYRIYKSGDYYRWWSSEDYGSKSTLQEDIFATKRQIDDHVIREMLKDK